MVTQTGKYALRILGYLVDHSGQWVQGRAIATDTGIPANYLSKILNQLRKHGFVESQKGWGGGFLLVEKATRVTIGEVLEAGVQLARPCQRHHLSVRVCQRMARSSARWKEMIRPS